MLKQPSQRISLRVFLIAVGLSAIGADPSVAQNDSEQPLQPADVYARVDVLRQELELIRLEMGRPRDGFVQFRVANVAPREVFFQALTLFGKSNQLFAGRIGTILGSQLLEAVIVGASLNYL